MLIGICFFLLLLTILGIVMALTRPTVDQKSMERRITTLKAAEHGIHAANAQLEQYLTTRSNSDYAWLEQWIADSGLARAMQLLIVQADSKSTVGGVLVQSAAIAAVAALAAFFFLHKILFVAAAGVVGALVPYLLLLFKRGSRLKKFENVLPDAVDMMSRSLRAGHSVAAAISIVAEEAVEPVRSEFAEVFKKQNYGLPLRDALLQMLERIPSHDLRVLVTGIMVQKDTGGNLVEILDRITAVVRDRQRIRREINTHTAQGRMTGYILCALPVVMMFLINLINPGYSNVLFEDPLGRIMLYAGVGLLVLGAVVIRQIINSIEI
jgi:tight adherence protein B